MASALRHAVMRGVLLAGFLVAAALLFHELVTLVAAGVITIIFAMLFSAVAAPLERWGVPRPLGAFLGVLAFFAALGGLLAVVVPPILAQFREFVMQLPAIVDTLAGHVASLTGGDVSGAGRRFDRALDQAVSDPGRFLGPAASIGLGIAGVLSALIIMLITAYFMAARPAPLVSGVLRLFPPERRGWAGAVFERLRAAWTGWMRGVLIDMVVTFVLLWAGLTAIGLDFAIMFAALSAVLVVVPYFGAIAGGFPPVLFGLAESTELGLLALGVYVLVQQIESNVIVPLVMARQVNLHPAVIAVGVVVVSQLFGLIGVFVAVPLSAAFVILVEELWVRPLERRRGIAVPDVLAVDRGGAGRWRRLRRERLEREDAHRRAEAMLRGENPDDVPATGEQEHDGALGRGTRRFLIVLGAPALALSLAITTVTTYVPVLINEVAGPAVTGALIGAEGLFALMVPILVGGWSDQVRTRIGRRMPFLLAATPVAAVALIAMPAFGSLIVLALALIVFYIAYFTYYAPYRALFPDLVASGLRGRSQGIQNTLREIGLGAALVSGGVLLGLWRPLPFLLATLVLAAVTVWFVMHVDESDEQRESPPSNGAAGVREAPRRVLDILRSDPPIRRIVLANALLEATVAAMKTFVVLYITVGLGRSMQFTSLALGVVAASVIAGALISGRMADRIGHLRILKIALPVYAVGLTLPLVSESALVLAAVPLGAGAAGIVMTLPYSMLMALMPEARHGAVSGIFEASRGIGVMAGPVLAGVAVELTRGVLPADGYSAAFGVAALAALLALPAIWRVPESPTAAAPTS